MNLCPPQAASHGFSAESYGIDDEESANFLGDEEPKETVKHH